MSHVKNRLAEIFREAGRARTAQEIVSMAPGPRHGCWGTWDDSKWSGRVKTGPLDWQRLCHIVSRRLRHLEAWFRVGPRPCKTKSLRHHSVLVMEESCRIKVPEVEIWERVDEKSIVASVIQGHSRPFSGCPRQLRRAPKVTPSSMAAQGTFRGLPGSRLGGPSSPETWLPRP